MSTVDDLRTARSRGERPAAPWADLRGADLYGADLYGADLRGADLYGADLRGADLYGADLYGADLRGADLRGADLRGADLCLQVTGLPSGQAVLYPTRDGWALVVGCWTGTPDTLRTLIAGETGWPEASASQRIERRPGLGLLADLCDDHIKRQPGVIEDLAQRWPAGEKMRAPVNLEAVAVTALASLGVRVGTRVPNPRPERFVRVGVVGGGAKSEAKG